MKISNVFRGLKFAAGAAAMLAVFTWTGAGSSMIGMGTAAYAATDPSTLTTDQIAAIQQSVTTALANIDPSLTGAARDAAVKQALAQVTASAVATYGPAAISVIADAAITAGLSVPVVVAAIVPAAIGAGVGTAEVVADVELGAVSGGASPTLVAEAIIATGTQNQLASDDVGAGLGQAAAILSKTNASGANEIAQVVANEGTSGMGESFASAVIANGGSQDLADAGTQNPNATGDTGGNNNGSNGGAGGLPTNGTGTQTLPPCDSPSCT